jgi:GNAT superfamily N-acetyltransferase
MSARPHSITITMDGTAIEVLFGEATHRQEIECYKLAATAWGSYLEKDEVIRREELLRHQPLARNGGCQTWCLYRADERSHVLSTCRTLRRDLLLNDPQGVHEEKGYCITSVVTSLPYRGHGLASHMLQNVARWLDGPGDAAISMLYSGMSDFYRKIGWTALSDTEIILSSNPWLQEIHGLHVNLEIRLLSDADIDDLCARDLEMLRAEAHRTFVIAKEAKLTILPIGDLVRFQHAHANYMGNLWHGEEPQNRGAAYQDRAWLYWYHDYRGRCLCIQHIRNLVQEDEGRLDVTLALILSAFREAEYWNFTTVTTWSISPRVRKALDILAQENAFNITVRETKRGQKISLRWRNGEERTTCTVMGNEAFAWNSRY